MEDEEVYRDAEPPNVFRGARGKPRSNSLKTLDPLLPLTTPGKDAKIVLFRGTAAPHSYLAQHPPTRMSSRSFFSRSTLKMLRPTLVCVWASVLRVGLSAGEDGSNDMSICRTTPPHAHIHHRQAGRQTVVGFS